MFMPGRQRGDSDRDAGGSDERVLDSNADDPFGFNQRNATAGSISQIIGQTLTVQRVIAHLLRRSGERSAAAAMRQYGTTAHPGASPVSSKTWS
jgi:hypothetical protein